MDDTCAVCAETLEWAAYGQCRHHEVCSTCIARLRFVCDDHRCCICKSESNVVFVTKALGDYTRMINDFSIFPVDPVEGQVGPYWYHEGMRAFFDDFNHYKKITAMCKLSCIVCDKKDKQGREGAKREGKFRNIEHFKSHLFHLHSLFMCRLCLKGRKKLYTRAQLNRHLNNGDSEVDGSETERGSILDSMTTTKNYDDLEIHFRQEHFLCEDEACLVKKFIVFVTESEIKVRHNAIEHGGHMSRSKRNEALQIPIDFWYRSREQDQSGRRRGSRSDYSDSQLSLAIQASRETANTDIPRATSSLDDHRETHATHQVVGQNSRNAPLEESSFPPLPVAASSSHQKPRNGSKRLGRTTMAAHLRRQNNVTVLNASGARPSATRQPTSLIGVLSQIRPVSNSGRVISSGSDSASTSRPMTVNGLVPSNFSSPVQIRSPTADGLSASSTSSSTSTNTRSSNKVTHSASTTKLVDRDSLDPTISDFPPVSVANSNILTAKNQTLPKVGGVHTANRSLVERICAELEFNEDKYAAFKVISSEYRQGIIDTGEYLAYVHQFGLSHLVLELARLCPDAQKQKELVEAYSSGLRSSGSPGKKPVDNSGWPKHTKSSKKGKEKCEDSSISSSNSALTDSIANRVSEMQSKGDKTIENHSVSVEGSKNLGNKPRKKTSKFHRVRLGESSSAAVLDLTNSDTGTDPGKGQSHEKTAGSERLPVRGAWLNGGPKTSGKLAMTR
ncbi:RING/U-box superfamily protein [Actinidia rufa]|uniref:RING/U-box superfamily protein n=1 Tax=Actinidia rufa TaxID=165716 RepID=A0A7J0G8Z0_9ERIC|nr:RING/U-box superfamily protein [Actinidia rufa]